MSRERYANTGSSRGGYRVKHKGRLFAFLALVLVIAAAVFVNSSFFDITDASVSVSGDERYHFEDIKSAAADKLFGINIFKLDEDAVESSIEDSNPYLDVTDIIRGLPNRVEIVVKEREPLYQFEYDGKYYDAADNGVIMSEGRSNDPALIQVAGFNIAPPQRGKKAEALDQRQQRDFDELMLSLRKYDFVSQVRSIDMTEETNITFMLRQGFKVIVGMPTQLQGKISCLSAALESVVEQGNTSGTLDISVAGNIYFSAGVENEGE